MVGISKSASGKAVDYYRPEREAEVLRLALKRNQGPLRDEEIARLFREIMSACLAQQEPLKVAFLGPEGTFTQAAVLKHFGSSVRALPLPAIDEVFHEVEGGIADFGVVPIENSSEGTVNHTLDMFLIVRPEDLRRSGAADQSLSDGENARHSSACSACAPIHRRWRNAAAGWMISCPMWSASPVSSNAEGRGARAMSAARRPSRATRPPRSTDSLCSPTRSRTGRTTPRGSWWWAENCSARAASDRTTLAGIRRRHR